MGTVGGDYGSTAASHEREMTPGSGNPRAHSGTNLTSPEDHRITSLDSLTPCGSEISSTCNMHAVASHTDSSAKNLPGQILWMLPPRSLVISPLGYYNYNTTRSPSAEPKHSTRRARLSFWVAGSWQIAIGIERQGVRVYGRVVKDMTARATKTGISGRIYYSRDSLTKCWR